MTRVDFYILPDVEADAKLRFACRLAMKAIGSGSRVQVHVPDDAWARQLDELMWHYPDGHFIPHALKTETDEAAGAPIIIGHDEPAAEIDDVLINLGNDVLPFFGRFERVAEVIVQPERAQGRDRYRHYRDRGYPLFHHELDDWED